MNYRHIYHAGNIGDVLKHIVQANIIRYLQKKEAPFRVFDTHAGIGLYDLTSEEAQKTGEWQAGVGKVLTAKQEKKIPASVEAVLAPWLTTITDMNEQGTITCYPGSPEISRRLLRKQDRLTLTELHPNDFEQLKHNFGGDKKTKLIQLDAWLALGSFLPPRERRGLVLVDPAYEVEDEFERLEQATAKAYKKWATGVYALWFPVKDPRSVKRLSQGLKAKGVKNLLSVELSAGRISPDQPMRSSGMFIINPPYTLKQQLDCALPWLTKCLAQSNEAYFKLEQLIPE
ncbi:23S rRNA (adenine(2030)-N(6))-methyltransferase RlmJ [Polycladidibacter stylochi]|uniref:23S rRNA (adenine(2030)-N(6))-methyltransferase RlmJ n=1 Tax=Polycladidibacter stylochi TaxID=1807766 RepID=UPI00083774FE|nr:23S rRNA (adenine(2030)-N(6))-methyltransferase RlmJ [Pseudovibrio stylochi]